MQHPERVAIFWDYESCPVTSSLNGYEIVDNVRCIAHTFGTVIQFKAYLENPSLATPSGRRSNLRSELQASGASLIDCPYGGGQKGVIGGMLLVDMIAFAIDHPSPATVIIISGNRDYAYAISVLRLRKYRVVVICPSNSHVSLVALASVHLDWNTEVLGQTPSEEPTAFSDIPNSRPPVTPTRARVNSFTSPGFLSSMSRAPEVDDEGDDGVDDGLYISRHDAPAKGTINPTQTNGFDGKYVSPKYLPVNDPLSRTQSPTGRSWGTSKPYSPPISFRSTKSPPSYLLPGDETAPMFETNKYPTLESLDLPKGFLVDEPEPITLKGRAPATENSGECSRSSHSVTQVQPSKQPEAEKPPSFVLPNASASILSDPFTLNTKSSAESTDLAGPSSSTKTEAPVPPTKLTPTVGSPAPTVKIAAAAPSPPVTSLTPKQGPILDSTSVAPSTTLPISTPKPSKPSWVTASSSKPTKKAVPSHFKLLIELLEARRQSQGQPHILRTDIGGDLAKHKNVYTLAGVSSFARYIELAQKEGIVDVGGAGNFQWVLLRPEWSP